MQPVDGSGRCTEGAAFAQINFMLFRELPPRGTPARAAFTLQLADRAAEQVRLRLREFLGDGVKLQEWIGTAWDLRLRAYPPTDGRPDITFENINRMDEFFSAYMPRDADGMPIPQPDDD